jgi:hypothetical protein
LVFREVPFKLKPTFRPVVHNEKLVASLKTTGDYAQAFATVYFDAKEEAQHTEVYCAFISEIHRHGDLIDRNGIALVPILGDGEIPIYRRVGFVALWDRVISKDQYF